MDSVSNKFNVARSMGRRSRPMELPQAAMPAPPAPDREGGITRALSGLSMGPPKSKAEPVRPKKNPKY